MPNDLSLEEAQKAVKSITIPPRPKLLKEVNTELQKTNPDENRVTGKIVKDVGLSVAVLKVINLPFFGLDSKVSSIPDAVHLLGMNNVKYVITGMMMKTALGSGEAMMLERFWDSSEKIARISAYLASILPKVPRDEAYTFGLLRECGIPLLMQRFPGYMETLKIASGQNEPMPVIEDQRHGTNHAVVGFMAAKSWGLSDVMSGAILRHHDYDIFSDSDDAQPLVRTLVAINFLSEYLNDEILRMRDSPAWNAVGRAVLEHLGIGAGEFGELREDVGAFVNQ